MFGSFCVYFFWSLEFRTGGMRMWGSITTRAEHRTRGRRRVHHRVIGRHHTTTATTWSRTGVTELLLLVPWRKRVTRFSDIVNSFCKNFTRFGDENTKSGHSTYPTPKHWPENDGYNSRPDSWSRIMDLPTDSTAFYTLKGWFSLILLIYAGFS